MEGGGEQLAEVLRKCCYPASKLHFSLSVLDLVEEQRLDLARHTLDGWLQGVANLTNSLAVNLVQLGSFGKDVLFVLPSVRLVPLAKALDERLLASELLAAPYPFAPHATIMKTSMFKKWRRKGGVRPRIPKGTWEDLDAGLGAYAFSEVQLLDMRRSDGEGYYEADWQAPLRSG